MTSAAVNALLSLALGVTLPPPPIRAVAGTAASFTQLIPALPDHMHAALAARGISAPTPIQHAAIPRALTGESMLLHAETGSGKSLAFLLPALVRLEASYEAHHKVLVVAPTREPLSQARAAWPAGAAPSGCLAEAGRGWQRAPEPQLAGVGAGRGLSEPCSRRAGGATHLTPTPTPDPNFSPSPSASPDPNPNPNPNPHPRRELAVQLANEAAGLCTREDAVQIVAIGCAPQPAALLGASVICCTAAEFMALGVRGGSTMSGSSKDSPFQGVIEAVLALVVSSQESKSGVSSK